MHWLKPGVYIAIVGQHGPPKLLKHLVNQMVIYRLKLLKVSKKGGRGRLAEMGGGWGLNGCES